MINILKGSLFFGAFAPPLGGMMLMLNMAILDPEPLHPLSELIEATLLSSLFAYLFGGIPALLTGAIAGIFRRFLGQWLTCLAIGCVGAVSSLLFVGTFLQFKSYSYLTDIKFSVMLAIPALLSGMVLSVLFRVRPNNLFNPDALKRAG